LHLFDLFLVFEDRLNVSLVDNFDDAFLLLNLFEFFYKFHS